MSRLRLAAMLLPVLLMTAGLFGLGLLDVLLESLGYGAVDGQAFPSLAPYRSLFADTEILRSFVLTLWVATASTAISAVAGVGCALCLRRLVKGRRAAYVLLQVPLAVPHLVMALTAIAVIGQSGLLARAAFALGWIDAPAEFPPLVYDRYGAGIIATYVVKEVPFLAIVTTALLLRINEDYDALARTLGAGAWPRFRRVTLPLIAPGVGGASLMVFAYVFAAFEVPFLLGRPFPAMLSVVAQRRFMSPDLVDRPAAMACALAMTVAAALVVRGYLALSRGAMGGDRPVLF